MLFGKKYHKSQMLELIRKLHMFAWFVGALLSAYCLLRCVAALDGTLNDFWKFRDLGSSKTFHHHLQNNGFYREVIPFLGVCFEWLHYSAHYCRVDKNNIMASKFWIFVILLILHIVVWLHARVLPLPSLPAWEFVESPVVQYRRFANMTILPSIFYFTVYFLRTRNVDS